MKNKLKNKNGSAMVLAMILIVLASIIMLILSKQILNQIKTTKNTQDSIQNDYNVQGNIEEGLGDFISKVSIEDNKESNSDSDANLKYEATQSIIYRVARDIKANLLEIQVINKQVYMPDEKDGKVKSEGSKIDSTMGTYPEIGKIMYDLYFNEIYTVKDIEKTSSGYEIKTAKKSPIDCVANQGEYINEMDENSQLNVLDALGYIDVNLTKLLNSQDLSGANLTKDKQAIKKLILQAQQYTQYLTDIVENKLTYYSYDNIISDEYVDNIDDKDINQLNSEVKTDIEYLEKVKESVSNLNKLDMKNEENKKEIEFIDDMLAIMNDIKSSGYIENLKKEIEKLKTCNNYEEKEDQVLKISKTIDEFYKYIGTYHYENEIMNIHMNGTPNESAGSEYNNDLSDSEKKSAIRVYSQFVRRYTKSTQVQLKYIKYKINKAFINEYIAKSNIQENVNNILNNLNQIKKYNEATIEINNEYTSITRNVKSLEKYFDDIEVFSKEGRSNSSQNQIYTKYDDNIGNIVVTLDSIIDELNSIEHKLIDLKDKTTSNSQKLDIQELIENNNKSMNSIIKVKYIFNGIWSDGDDYIPKTNNQGKLIMKLPNDFTILENDNGKVQVNLSKVRVNDTDYTSREKDTNGYKIVEIKPRDNIDIYVVLESKLKKSSSSLKVKAKISIINLKGESSYNINYRILEWNNN